MRHGAITENIVSNLYTKSDRLTMIGFEMKKP